MALINHIVEQLHPQPSPDWLAALRRRLSDQLRDQALPTRRDENWKYSSLAALEKRELTVALREPSALTPADIQPFVIPNLDCWRLVFVNGHFQPALSFLDALPAGIRFTDLAGADVDVMDGLRSLLDRDLADDADDRLAVLNTAALADGVVLEVGKDVAVDKPLHCLFLNVANHAGLAINLRNIVQLGPGASLRLIEHYAALGEPAHVGNVVNQFVLNNNASLDHVRLQQDSDAATLLTRQETRQHTESTYRYFGFDLGGAFARHDLNARLEGEGAHCQFNGAYALDGNRHVDNHSRVDHVAPNATSGEFFKGVLDGRSRAVFNGKVVVHPGADGSDAKQTNNNLLLSKLAEVDTKPELEIYADDVKCAHGATVGQLDETQLFYLRSRGIPQAEARLLLTYAFCREVVDTIDDEVLREFVSEQVVAHLPRVEGLGDAA